VSSRSGLERHNINQQGPERTTVVVAAAELSHNAAWLGYTLAQLCRHLGQLVPQLGSHFPQWGQFDGAYDQVQHDRQGAFRRAGFTA
jgi:hypothetical protein